MGFLRGQIQPLRLGLHTALTRFAPLGWPFSLACLDAKPVGLRCLTRWNPPLQRVEIHPRGTQRRVRIRGRATHFVASSALRDFGRSCAHASDWAGRPHRSRLPVRCASWVRGYAPQSRPTRWGESWISRRLYCPINLGDTICSSIDFGSPCVLCFAQDVRLNACPRKRRSVLLSHCRIWHICHLFHNCHKWPDWIE